MKVGQNRTVRGSLVQDNFLYENQFVSAGDEADDESDIHRKSSRRVFHPSFLYTLYHVCGDPK